MIPAERSSPPPMTGTTSTRVRLLALNGGYGNFTAPVWFPSGGEHQADYGLRV